MTFDKIQYSFMRKTQERLGVEEIYLNIIKAIYDRSITTILLNGKKNCCLPIVIEHNIGYQISPHLLSIVVKS